MVSVRVGNRRFSPSVFGTGAAILTIAAFVRLGLWQLDRAEEKRALLAQFAAGQQTLAQLTTANAATLPRYQQVRAAGRYDSARQVLLDNMPSLQGQAGFRVVTPFELSSGAWILVDRGWVPLGRSRADLPDIAVDEMPRHILARVDELPQPGLRMRSSQPVAQRWPQVLNFPERAELERALELSVLAYVVLDPSQADGYERSAQVQLRFGPERHVGYAVQWFALAFTVLVAFVVVSLKSESRLQ